jgi:hypothetical protein
MRTLFVIFCIAAIVQLSCEKSPNGPEPVKDPRQYTWAIDTLTYPGSLQTSMRSIWGSSPKDVYVVGHNDRGFGKMYHYDGKSWKPVDLAFGAIDLSAVYGFAANDVWAVGERIDYNPNPPPNFLDSSLVIHFDGNQWRELRFPRQRGLTSIWGSGPNDIWIGGLFGTLYHYDGKIVKSDSVPFPIPKAADFLYSFSSIVGGTSGEAYLLLSAPLPNGADRFYLFRRQASTWVIADSVFSWRSGLWVSPSGALYATGYGVHKRVGTSWLRVLDEITTTEIAGTGDDNFLVVGNSPAGGLSGEVYHYNGTDWYQFKNLQFLNIQYSGVWTNGKEAFVIGVTFGGYPQKTIILHGK